MALNHQELLDTMNWVEEQKDKFMVPMTYKGDWVQYENDNGETLFSIDGDIPNEDLDEGNYGLVDHGTDGWFARLSAPGFLDCADCVGPCKSEEEALVELFRLYGE